MDGLTAKDLQGIRTAYVLNRDLEQQIERAKACEFDCAEQDERCQHAKRVMDKILQVYGPSFPKVKDSG